jgi:hypothetical protein
VSSPSPLGWCSVHQIASPRDGCPPFPFIDARGRGKRGEERKATVSAIGMSSRASLSIRSHWREAAPCRIEESAFATFVCQHLAWWTCGTCFRSMAKYNTRRLNILRMPSTNFACRLNMSSMFSLEFFFGLSRTRLHSNYNWFNFLPQVWPLVLFKKNYAKYHIFLLWIALLIKFFKTDLNFTKFLNFTMFFNTEYLK